MRRALTNIQYLMDEHTILEKLSKICVKDTKELPCVDPNTVDIDIVPQVVCVPRADRVHFHIYRSATS